jgi:hypothetical protein
VTLRRRLAHSPSVVSGLNAVVSARSAAIDLRRGGRRDEPRAVEIGGDERAFDNPNQASIDRRRYARRDHDHVGTGGDERRNLRRGHGAADHDHAPVVESQEDLTARPSPTQARRTARSISESP